MMKLILISCILFVVMIYLINDSIKQAKRKRKIKLVKSMIEIAIREHYDNNMNFFGFCYLYILSTGTFSVDYNNTEKELIKALPELLKYKPEHIECNHHGFWFSGYEVKKRIAILEEILNALENENR